MMTTTLEQIQTEWRKLIEIAQNGEDVMITSQGRVVARLTGVASVEAQPKVQPWLEKLGKLRENLTTGKAATATEEILNGLRADRQ